MKIELPEQGIEIIVSGAIGDIDPVSDNPVVTVAELNQLNQNIHQKLAERLGYYLWSAGIKQIRRIFSSYQEYKFYEKSIRELIIASLGLKQHADGSITSLTYQNIDDLARVFQLGYEWLWTNKTTIRQELKHKARREFEETAFATSQLIDQYVDDNTPNSI
jgi:hypothetical protein